MKRTKRLEDHIIAIYQNKGNQKLRWSQIRNELLIKDDIPEDVRNSEGFSVKLSRALNRLRRDEILEKHEKGHQNVSYSLAENAAEKLIQRDGPFDVIIGMVGCYKPGDSWEDVKKRALQQWIELFEELHEPELKKHFEEADRHFRKSKSSVQAKSEPV